MCVRVASFDCVGRNTHLHFSLYLCVFAAWTKWVYNC